MFEQQPPGASIAVHNTSSSAAKAIRIASASASHRRVEPSTSVNKNVTTPEGEALIRGHPQNLTRDTPDFTHRPKPARIRAPRHGVALPVGRIVAAICDCRPASDDTIVPWNDSGPAARHDGGSWCAGADEGLVIRDIWPVATACAAGVAHGDAAVTRTCGIATATWRKRLASKDMSPGPR